MNAASEQRRAERERAELLSAGQRDLDAFTSREHRAHVADRLQCDVQIRDQPRRRDDEGEA